MVCIFDCETVPDIELVKKNFDISSSENIDIANEAFELQKEKSGSSFLPIPFHQVVSISAVICDKSLKFNRVSTIDGNSEREMIKNFLDFIDKHNPKLVSFNGRGFDMPMLLVRAMKYNLSCKSFFDTKSPKSNYKNYRYRFDETYHFDLMDSISEFGAVRGLNLDTLASMMQLPGKFDVHGSEVHTLYFNNEQDKINQYCESDVLNTYWLLLKYELLRGNLSIDSYLSILQDQLEKLPKDKSYSEVFKDSINDELNKNGVLVATSDDEEL
jgi:predicted PolB exonuclease-like 3'-5' exonuclease